MALPAPTSKVLEDGDAALIEASTEAEIVEDPNTDSTEEEIVDFAAMTAAPAKPDVPADVPAAKPPVKKAAAPSADDELPEELRGKTPAQLAKMYREAQALIGRQGSELGEFRKKADLLIQASLANMQRNQPAKKTEPVADPVAAMDESEIFAKPKDAIAKMIENHPAIQGIRKQLGQAAASQASMRAQAASERFMQAHPDAADVISDPEFRQWVAASPVRKQLFLAAHTKFDFNAGDEIFSTWKALKGVGKRSSTEGTTDGAQDDKSAVSAAASTLAKQAAAKRAAAAAAAAAPTGGASAGKSGGAKKIYRRADVLRLMEEQPDRYEMMADELTLAYKEGRVR
jgi:hypothetical protein